MAHAKSLPELSRVHPMVLFWLGLLTGAIVVGFVFFYRVLAPMDYQSATISTKLKNFATSPTSTTQMLKTGTASGIAPHGSVAPNGTGAASGIAPHGSVAPNDTGAASGIAPHGMIQ